MRKIDNETTEDNLYDMVDYVCIKLQKDCLAEKRIIYCEVADSQNTGIRWGSTGQPTGDRYRYLENDSKDDNRYIYLNDDSYKTVSSRYRGERTAITVNNTIAAQTTSDYDTEYFVTDLLGSVSCITGPTGSLKSSFTYDAFGSLVQGKLTGTSDFGYLGKQKDPTSTLYNYGYRDYTPQLSRFTTPDPIRDGPNWFSYCNSDPVNFVDLWGLEVSDKRNNIHGHLLRVEVSYTTVGGKNKENRGKDLLIIENADAGDYTDVIEQLNDWGITDKFDIPMSFGLGTY